MGMGSGPDSDAVWPFFVLKRYWMVGGTLPRYLVRRVIASPPRVSYWTRSKPAKMPGLESVPPIRAANPAMVSRPTAGRPSPRWGGAKSLRGGEAAQGIFREGVS